MTDNDTQPVADDDARLEPGGEEGEPIEAAPQTDDELADEAAEAAEPEEDEFELDGETLRLPKTVAPYLMRQADYTRKTQELADQRRAFEQSRAQQAEMAVDEIRLVGRIQVLGEQVAQYDALDWDGLEARDPAGAQRLWREREQLKDAWVEAGGQLQHSQRARAEDSVRSAAEAVQDREQALADPDKGIKGWGPELAGKLTEFAHGEFGVSSEEIAAQTDPRAIQVLHRAYSLDQEVKSLRRRLGLQQQQSIRPAPKPGGNAGAGSRDLSRLAGGDFKQFEAALAARAGKGR